MSCLYTLAQSEITATQTSLGLWFQTEFPTVHHLTERRSEESTVSSFPGTHSVPIGEYNSYNKAKMVM